MIENYKEFLTSKFSKQWGRIGIKKRSGVAAPLFSVYSKESIGIGELPDLKLLIDWCVLTDISILQLFPMNDVGFNFRPYDAESSFALDPMYLSLSDLKEASVKEFSKEISVLRKKFPAGGPRVNYAVKKAKLEILRKIFLKTDPGTSKEFKNYQNKNKFWLRDHAYFRVLKERLGQRSWEEWPSGLDMSADMDVIFYEWLQWQLYEQFIEVKEYAKTKKIFLMGDLPFLVSRDSADVWAHQNYFKLDLASGAPPDLYFAKGQRWGMPPYNWGEIENHQFDYLIQKLKYAENFYDLFRIDHFVGIFRIWTIRCSDPQENAGYYGKFDPENESLWEEHGQKILNVIVENTRMLPCAEDLGAVPACSYKALEEFGIPGMDIQRWSRDWGKTYDFIPSEKYRKNSVAVISTHDMSPFAAWWKFEIGTVDEELLRIKCQQRNLDLGAIKNALFDLPNSGYGRLVWKKDVKDISVLLSRIGLAESEAWDFIDIYRATYDERERFWKYVGLKGRPDKKFNSELLRNAFLKVDQGASIFSIQLLQDWLSLDSEFKGGARDFRINVPGTMNDKNWTLVMPLSLEELKKAPILKLIKSLNEKTSRG